jgi:hypothetical protein
MIIFVDNYLQLEDDKQIEESLFDTNNLCILYFSMDDDEEYRKEIIGTYPGDMNNFSLTSSADFWSDPEESFSNVYLDKQISENKDYLILTKDIYSKIIDSFGVFQEIERRSVFNKESLEIEIHLKKVNFIINKYNRLKYYS